MYNYCNLKYESLCFTLEWAFNVYDTEGVTPNTQRLPRCTVMFLLGPYREAKSRHFRWVPWDLIPEKEFVQKSTETNYVYSV